MLSDTALSGGGNRAAFFAGLAGRSRRGAGFEVGRSCLGAERGLLVASGLPARKPIARSTEFVGLFALLVSGLNLDKDLPLAPPEAAVLTSNPV